MKINGSHDLNYIIYKINTRIKYINHTVLCVRVYTHCFGFFFPYSKRKHYAVFSSIDVDTFRFIPSSVFSPPRTQFLVKGLCLIFLFSRYSRRLLYCNGACACRPRSRHTFFLNNNTIRKRNSVYYSLCTHIIITR